MRIGESYARRKQKEKRVCWDDRRISRNRRESERKRGRAQRAVRDFRQSRFPDRGLLRQRVQLEKCPFTVYRKRMVACTLSHSHPSLFIIRAKCCHTADLFLSYYLLTSNIHRKIDVKKIHTIFLTP